MSTPQDPFAPPGDGEQQPQQPPAYGAQPPAYGSQPPAYGQQPTPPPAYGQQPAYGQAPAYGQQPYPPAYVGPPNPKNSLGVWAIVLAGVAFLCAGPLASIPGVILGHLALKANKEGLASNYGMSLAATIINWIITVGYVVLIIWVFAFGGLEWYMDLIEESMTTTG